MFIQKNTAVIFLCAFLGIFPSVAFSDELPGDFPAPIVKSSDNPIKGFYYAGLAAGFNSDPNYFNYIAVMDSLGTPLSYRKIGYSDDGKPYYFRQAADGNLIYAAKNINHQTLYYCDSTLKVLDSVIIAGPGDDCRFFTRLTNGNYLLILNQRVPYDLSKVFDGGDPNSYIINSVIYEFDIYKNPVFIWSALDYYSLLDTYTPLSNNMVLADINSLVQDDDGNFIISAGAMSEITKISGKTGEIIWRLGGKNNQFTFNNENEENAPLFFSNQHDIQRLANGNFTLFDNGSQHSPQYSRAVEYKLDEEKKTADMVWEYRPEADAYSEENGSCQRLENGNTVIGWGDASSKGYTGFTEFNPDKSTAFEMDFPEGFSSSGVYKYPWITAVYSDRVDKEVLKKNTYSFAYRKDTTYVSMTLKELEGMMYKEITVFKYDYSPMNADFEEEPPPALIPKKIYIKTFQIFSFNADVRINAAGYGILSNPEEYAVYRRDSLNKKKFVRMPSIYNPAKGTYEFNTSVLGEFVIGKPAKIMKPLTPLLLSPANGERVNMAEKAILCWQPRGSFKSSQLQVSTDSAFENILTDSTIYGNLCLFNTNGDERYFWRVRINLADSSSEWSETRSFTFGEPYINITFPDGGEILIRKNPAYIIRWDKNISGSVKIELLKNGEPYSVIADNLVCPTGGYLWTLTQDIENGSSYQIKVSGIDEQAVYDVSSNFFTIADDNGVNESRRENDIEITNYPNPFSSETTFYFNLEKASNVSISVFDVLGRFRKEIFNDFLFPASHSVEWKNEILEPGVYYYLLSVGDNSIMKRFAIY